MVQLSIPTAASRRRSGLIEWTVPEQGQSHNATVLADWFHLHLLGLDGSDRAILDGCSLTIPAVTAVARYVSPIRCQHCQTSNSCTIIFVLLGLTDRKLLS